MTGTVVNVVAPIAEPSLLFTLVPPKTTLAGKVNTKWSLLPADVLTVQVIASDKTALVVIASVCV